jgi:hypothetical protein
LQQEAHQYQTDVKGAEGSENIYGNLSQCLHR